MTSAADHFNRLNRMSPAERDAEILRAAFGPFYSQLIAAPVADLRAERIRREREASERRHDARHPEPPEAA